MDGAVETITCLGCNAELDAATLSGRSTCPRCGRALDASADLERGDQALVDNLRRAFATNQQQLADAEECWLDQQPGELKTLTPGTRLGDFEIVGELGRGGMGVVYRARQVSLGRTIALKVLPPEQRNKRVAVQRFRAEAEAAARTHHTNVVSVYAQGYDNGTYFYAMELIDGIGLDQVIRGRPGLLNPTRAGGSSTGWALEPDRDLKPRPDSDTTATGEAAADDDLEWSRADYRHLAALLAEVADALDCAHGLGIIHRDVKPRNLLLGIDDRLHLTDFGLARLTDEPHMTLSGEIMGTPAYLSPEQVSGDIGAVDHRTDIYSLGVTLYELLTRRKPFAGHSREQIIAAIHSAQPPTPRRLNRRIPVELETICLRAIEKTPGRRYASAGQMADDLRRYAEGRPILARRPSLLTKVVRWSGRHRAASVALVAALALVVLSVGWLWTASAGRAREARTLTQHAYQQLAYLDYHSYQQAAAEIEQAAELGADSGELHLARALVSMGQAEWPAAAQQVRAALDRDNSDPRAWYLLAWAEREDGRRAAARDALEQAEFRHVADSTLSADAWFFRALALHFDQPAAAAECYREANARRAAQHAFYPQAVLHLARARNQQIYTTRALDGLPEADTALRQLIEHQHYGAYPHYLLSITHRLAAEIYSGSHGTRDDSLVRDHYEQALHWARAGQDADPASERPITAEAECLESMGRFADARDTRTRAIELTDNRYARCENLHYRWRLHYWLGDLDAALEDAEAHAACMPESRCYAHFYPALILAEQGDMDAALGHARALASEAPESALAVLWSATCLRLLGEGSEAVDLLDSRADSVDFAAQLAPPQSAEWLRALYEYCQTSDPSAELDEITAQSEMPWKLWGAAHFHIAALRLGTGDRTAAIAEFQRSYRSFDGELGYTYHARLLLEKLRENDAWPGWIDVSWNEEAGSNSASDGKYADAPQGGY